MIGVNGWGVREGAFYPWPWLRFLFLYTYSWNKYRESTLYSAPCDLRPLHLTITLILRPLISDTTLIFPVQISLHFKATSTLRPYFPGWMGGLKMQGPLHILEHWLVVEDAEGAIGKHAFAVQTNGSPAGIH